MALNETPTTLKENIMFGYNYKFTVNETKNTIKLKPTAGTYVKAFAPTLVVYGGLVLLGSIARRQEKKNRQNTPTPETV
jgi:hypothetical protein